MLALAALTLLVAADDAAALKPALALESSGDDTGALRALDALVRAGPALALARIEAARIRLKRGDELDQAELDLEVARSIAPENPRVHFLYGQLMEERGNGAEALRSLERAVLERPEFWEARERLAALYGRQGDWAHAEEQYRAVAHALPDRTPARLQLAFVLEKEGRPSEAIAELKRLLDAQPGSVVVARRLAELYDRTDQPKLAARIRATLDPASKRKMRDLKKSSR